MFFKRYTEKSDSPNWGGATYYFETDTYGKPVRELAVYDNGHRRGYDLQNPTDEYGSLPSGPLFSDNNSKDEWRQYQITKTEFHSAWKGEPISTEEHQKAVNSVHSAGTWAIVLGVLNIIVTPLLELLVTPTNGQSKTSLVVTASIIGLVIGGIYIGLGLKLKQTHTDTLLQAKKVLIFLSIFVLVIGVFTLVQSGHSLGILNYILLFVNIQALSKIQKLKKNGLV